MNGDKKDKYIVDESKLPDEFPTHFQTSDFWESLGRAVATFGFLEETLAKAIFAFTATKTYNESEIEEAFLEWVPKLERTLTDTLGSLIDTYGKAVKEHQESMITNFDDLLNDLREISKIRNVLCHGSWRMPNSNGASVPFFVNRKKEMFETAVDLEFINEVQRNAAKLACEVFSSVTCMGWQFPGSSGPGKVIWSA